MQYIKYKRPYLTTFWNTQKRVENTTRSGVLRCLEVWLNIVLSVWYILSTETTENKKESEEESRKILCWLRSDIKHNHRQHMKCFEFLDKTFHCHGGF